MGDRVCRCAHPAVMADTALYRWPAGVPLTWFLDRSTVPAGLSPDHVEASLSAGFAVHARHCGITVLQSPASELARLVVSFQPIDGPDNVLAETQLPVDVTSTSQLWMHLDSSEAWTPQSLFGVGMHEFGHFLGLGHVQEPTVAVMNPFYNAALTDLQQWDTWQDEIRYGRQVGAPPTRDESISIEPITFTVTVPSAGSYLIVFDGADEDTSTIQFTASGPGPASVTITPTSAKRVQ